MLEKTDPFPVRALHRTMEFLNAVGSVWVAIITILICGDIFGRVMFNTPIIGVPEIVRVSVVGIVWFQFAYALKIGAHLRSEIILYRLPEKGKIIVDLIGCILGLIIFALVVYSGWDPMIEGWRIKEFEGELPVRVPTYPIRTIVLIGATLTALQYFLFIIRDIHALFTGGPAEVN